MQYRRNYQENGCYFFTVVTHKRQNILTLPNIRNALRYAVIKVKQKYPFTINAIVLLPDHLHTLWTLPENDANFSERWRQIKRYVQHQCKLQYPKIWQSRFWEHTIRNEEDYNKHMDYIHYNPVKHGYVNNAIDWEFSSFHKFVELGWYTKDWGSNDDFILPYD